MKALLLILACICLTLVNCTNENVSKKDSRVPKETKLTDSIKESFFSEILRIPAVDSTNGFLEMTVTSSNEKFLNTYTQKYKNTKVQLRQVDRASLSSSEKDQIDLEDIQKDTLDTIVRSVKIHFNWDNFSFNKERGKLYEIAFTSKNTNKWLYHVGTFPNVNEVSSNLGFGAVRVINTTKYFSWNCLCTVKSGTWTFHKNLYATSSQSEFYYKHLGYHDNLEVRTARILIPPTLNLEGLPSFNEGGITIHFIPRLNYVNLFGSMNYNYFRDFRGIKRVRGNKYDRNVKGTVILHFVG